MLISYKYELIDTSSGSHYIGNEKCRIIYNSQSLISYISTVWLSEEMESGESSLQYLTYRLLWDFDIRKYVTSKHYCSFWVFIVIMKYFVDQMFVVYELSRLFLFGVSYLMKCAIIVLFIVFILEELTGMIDSLQTFHFFLQRSEYNICSSWSLNKHGRCCVRQLEYTPLPATHPRALI